jgi:DNA-binding transcriptional LysR family regulator
MDRLTALRVYRRVVELGAFAAAARDLGLSKAAISKNVSELEAHLGVRLLERSTRRLRVTGPGDAYFRRVVRILDEIEEADLEASEQAAAPRGLLRVSAPMSFGLLRLSPLVASFLGAHPAVEIDLVLNDRAVDLLEENFDVAIRGGDLADSSLVARRLTGLRRVLCAAPGYLAARGAPLRPADLAAHDCLVYSLSRAPRDWRFDGPNGAETVRVSGRYAVNSSIALRDAAEAGAGLALLPRFAAEEALAAGRLVAVMELWRAPDSALHALHPNRRYVPPKVRRFIDHLAAGFAGLDCHSP